MDPNRNHCVEFGGALLPAGSCVIHFYYTAEERARFADFLREGLQRGEGAVLACPAGCLAQMEDWLALPAQLPARYERVTICGSEALPDVIQAAGRVVQYGPARMLVDFAALVPQEALCEVEARLFSAISGLPLVSLTQYDGASFTAPVMLEQFRTHALAIAGNAFYQENQRFTSPARYLQMRARAASSRS